MIRKQGDILCKRRSHYDLKSKQINSVYIPMKETHIKERIPMNKSINLKNCLKTTTSLVLALGLISSNISFASSVSKLEYTKSLVKGLGFEIQDASDAYKKETTNEENIIYTAFQMRLLKGVSWDFHNDMTESERQVILSNAMAIYKAQHGKNSESESAEESKTVESDSSVSNETNVDSSSDIQWETEWGVSIKKPSDFNVNDGLWTDEEFIQLIKDIPESFYTTDDTIGNVIFIDTEDDYQENLGKGWYFDTDKEQFIFEVGYDHERRLINMDELTNGEFFNTLKVLTYNAYVNDMRINIPRVYGNAINMFISSNHDYEKITYSFRFEEGTGADDILYVKHGHVDFDKNKTPIQEEWELYSLIPNENYEQFDYIFDGTEGSQARWGNAMSEYDKSIEYVDQSYADFLYGVCDGIYVNDGAKVYAGMMYSYLKARVCPREEGERLDFFDSQEFENTWLHTVYAKYIRQFGITRK